MIKDIFNKIYATLAHRDANSPEEICHEIATKGNNNGSPFLCFENGVHCFDLNHWVLLSKSEIKALLTLCNCKITGDHIKGRSYTAVDKLCKQFPYTCLSLNTDQAKDKINFINGTLDLHTMTLNPHNHYDYFRYVLPYCYDPNASCPLFESYLNRVMPDKEAQMVIAEYIGWFFTPNLKLEKVLFLYGQGCNGKSVLVDITEALVGKDNISHESISDMCNGERGANHRANIIGKILNTCSDVAPNAFSGDVFKRLASGEPISAKILYEDVITTTNYAKMMFCLNELPKTNDTSKGYYRRFLIAPFNVQIPLREIDPKLAQKIISAELPGIMNWVLKGRARLIKQNGFSHCELFDNANNDYLKGAKKVHLYLPPFYD